MSTITKTTRKRIIEKVINDSVNKLTSTNKPFNFVHEELFVVDENINIIDSFIEHINNIIENILPSVDELSEDETTTLVSEIELCRAKFLHIKSIYNDTETEKLNTIKDMLLKIVTDENLEFDTSYALSLSKKYSDVYVDRSKMDIRESFDFSKFTDEELNNVIKNMEKSHKILNATEPIIPDSDYQINIVNMSISEILKYTFNRIKSNISFKIQNLFKIFKSNDENHEIKITNGSLKHASTELAKKYPKKQILK